MCVVPIAEILFPARCLACSRRAAGGAWAPYLCQACSEAVPGPPVRVSVDIGLPVRTLAIHQGPTRDLLHALKYSGRTGVARRFGPLLSALTTEAGTASRVIPVPLHWARRWRRGYDQAFLLARALTRANGGVVLSAALSRRRRTAPQVGLAQVARSANVEGVFRARSGAIAGHRGIAGHHCILVDDVVTTGATLAAAARALRIAGARPVLAVTVAASPLSVSPRTVFPGAASAEV